MSERSISTELKTAAESSVYLYILMAELQFPSGTVYVHNGTGDHVYDGNTYKGVGGFGSIDTIRESNKLVESPITLTLSSITPEIIDAVRNDDIYLKEVNIYLAALDKNYQLSGTPNLWFAGYMEKRGLKQGAENAVAIRCQSWAARLKQRNGKRFTLEDHQVDSPGDLFFEFLQYVVSAEVTWAGEKVRTGFRNTSGLGGSNSDERDGYGGGYRRER